MELTLIFHVLGGSLGLITGYTALYSRKGGRLHKRSGIIFVYAMLLMAGAGALYAAVRSVAPAVNLTASVLTAYLVITSLMAVRTAPSRGLHLALTAVPLGLLIVNTVFAGQAIANGGTRNGIPAFPFFLFGSASLFALIGDLRILGSGALQGAARVARHLWRMTFALLVAALSFFIGQADVIPEPLRIRPLLALPVLAVLFSLFYWLWRVRIRHALEGLRLAESPRLSRVEFDGPPVDSSVLPPIAM